jgi:hypothetical protein
MPSALSAGCRAIPTKGRLPSAPFHHSNTDLCSPPSNRPSRCSPNCLVPSLRYMSCVYMPRTTSRLVYLFVPQFLVAATPTTMPRAPPPTSNQCCRSVVLSTSTAASAVAGILGLDLTGLDVPVGLSCSPITVGGDNW